MSTVIDSRRFASASMTIALIAAASIAVAIMRSSQGEASRTDEVSLAQRAEWAKLGLPTAKGRIPFTGLQVGHVLDQSTGKGIADATIDTEPRNAKAHVFLIGIGTVGPEGRYWNRAIGGPGDYELRVSAKGYRPQVRRITMEPHELEIEDFELVPQP